jgi:predicted DNA-binding helix-hairpin-helix protein
LQCDQYLCKYCFTSCAIKRKRTTFKPDELATTFVSLQREKRVDGLFLSSPALAQNPPTGFWPPGARLAFVT